MSPPVPPPGISVYALTDSCGERFTSTGKNMCVMAVLSSTNVYSSHFSAVDQVEHITLSQKNV